MFDVGFTELMLIGIVSLIVIGPERLPAVARTAGQWIGKVQRFVRGVKTDLASELESGDLKKLIGDQREQINELKDMVHSAKKDFQSTTQKAVVQAKKGLEEMETTMREADAGETQVSETATTTGANATPPAKLEKGSKPAAQSAKGMQGASNSDVTLAKATGDGEHAANSDSGPVDGMDRTGTDAGK